MKRIRIFQAVALGVIASMIFYCGQAYRLINDAGAQDGGTDAGAPADAGADPCVNCPEPEPPFTIQVHDVETSPDASAVIPVPAFPSMIIQAYQRSTSNSGPYWLHNGEDCQPRIWTEPHAGYPGLPLPAILYPEGIHRQCRIVLLDSKPMNNGGKDNATGSNG